MENPAAEKIPLHSEGDTLRKVVDAETAKKKPRFKWLPRLPSIKDFFRKKEDKTDYEFIREAEIGEDHLQHIKREKAKAAFRGDQTFEELSRQAIDFGALIAARNKLQQELQEDDIGNLPLAKQAEDIMRQNGEWHVDNTGSATPETRQAWRDSVYTQMILIMRRNDEEKGESRFLKRVAPHAIAKIDAATHFFKIYHELGIFPLVSGGVKGNPTRVDGLKISWGVPLDKAGGSYFFADSIHRIIDWWIKDKSGLGEKMKRQVRASFSPLKEVNLAASSPGEDFKTLVLMGAVSSGQENVTPANLLHEITHSLHSPADVGEEILLLFTLFQKHKGIRDFNFNEYLKFTQILLYKPELLKPVFEMLSSSRQALAEGQTYSRDRASFDSKLPSARARVEGIDNARKIDLMQDPLVQHLKDEPRRLKEGGPLFGIITPPSGEPQMAVFEGEARRETFKQWQAQLAARESELMAAAPKLYPYIDKDQLIYAVITIDKLDALGLTPQEVGGLIKNCGYWDETSHTFPDLEEAIAEKQQELNLTSHDVENLVIARRLEREIDALRAQKIAREEVKKFYSEYYAAGKVE